MLKWAGDGVELVWEDHPTRTAKSRDIEVEHQKHWHGWNVLPCKLLRLDIVDVES